MSKRRAAVEETRSRIVEATLELHDRQGIGATSWEQIAERAGVGVGTVYRHFPTLSELVPACGVVTFERLALPAPGEIPGLFSGFRSRSARMRRLVEILFRIYAREPGAIENVRRERGELDLPALDEAHERLEATFDALTAEALRPFAAGERQRRAVRALTDLPVWRSLAARGVIGDDAVAVATAAALAALDAG